VACLKQIFGLILFLGLVACGGGSSTPVAPPPVLRSIAVTPNAPSVPAGGTQQFKATGTYSDNTNVDLTSKVSWSSADELIARFSDSSPGLAQGVGLGATVVTAKLGSVSGTTTVSVYPILISIDIGPNPGYTGVGLTLQLIATGTYSDGAPGGSVDATWESSDPSVAAVNSAGQVTGISLGTATITASDGRITASVSISVIAGKWVPTGDMLDARSNHTATLLPNGKVLIAAGGEDSVGLTSTELYDPATGMWSTTGSLSSPRLTGFTATLLPNGKVLVVGGFAGGTTTLSSAEVYDPATGTWSATGSLPTKLCWHTATLLQNGKVLVAGGSNDFNLGPTTPAAELYDPATGTWSPTGNLSTARQSHSATLLQNGNVLVVGGVGSGGYLSSAELYDPIAGTWSATENLPIAVGNGQTVTLLSNSQVLVAGGQNATGYLSNAELYDPVVGTWTSTGSLSMPRIFHTATPLADGTVLVAGGRTQKTPGFGISASAEIYDPAAGTWFPTGSLVEGRVYHSATILPDGVVLVAGGLVVDPTLTTVSAELYTAL
jgi:hypothetical protein